MVSARPPLDHDARQHVANRDEGAGMRSWGRRAAVVGSLGCVVLAGAAVPAQGGGAQVTRGDFVRLGALEHEPHLAGTAQLVRNAAGRTLLSVQVKGLQAGETYGVHLHNLPCSDVNPGGAHYKHDPAGVPNPPNELWASSQSKNPMAGVRANAAGHARGNGVASWVARPEAQAVVIHADSHSGGTPAGGPKLACADLR